MKKEINFTVTFTNVPDRIYSTVMTETNFKTDICLDWQKHLEFAESTLAELTACVKVYEIFDDIKKRVIAEYEAELKAKKEEEERRANEDKGPY